MQANSLEAKILHEKECIIQDFVTKIKRMQGQVHQKEYQDGSEYYGELHNDLRNGWGIYHYNTGDVYCGHWKADLFDGEGCYIFNSGERF